MVKEAGSRRSIGPNDLPENASFPNEEEIVDSSQLPAGEDIPIEPHKPQAQQQRPSPKKGEIAFGIARILFGVVKHAVLLPFYPFILVGAALGALSVSKDAGEFKELMSSGVKSFYKDFHHGKDSVIGGLVEVPSTPR